MTDYSKERQIAIEAVIKASKLCDQVFKTLVQANDAITKKDKSPVTLADFGAQAIVNWIIKNNFPEDSIVGEEESSFLRSEEGQSLSDRIFQLVNEVADKPVTRDQILDAIDLGDYEGGSSGRFWTLDPVDGTKGFLRGGQYAVCLALVVDGEVQLGVMGGPNLSVDFNSPSSPKGTLFIAQKGKGAYQRSFQDTNETPVSMRLISDLSEAKFCESVEAGHSSHDDSHKIAVELGLKGDSVKMDSQCKYASISRGDGDIYLRLPVSASYEEKIWDHASGVLLVGEAGGKVTDVNGNKIDFSQGRTLKLNKGIVASHANHHARVLGAVQKVLSDKQAAL